MTRGFFIVLTTWWNDLQINASRTFLMSIFIAERWHVTDDRALHDTLLMRRSSSFVLLHNFCRISSKWSRFPGNQRLLTKNPFCHRLVRAGRGQTSFDSRLINQGGPKSSLFWYVFDDVLRLQTQSGILQLSLTNDGRIKFLLKVDVEVLSEQRLWHFVINWNFNEKLLSYVLPERGSEADRNKFWIIHHTPHVLISCKSVMEVAMLRCLDLSGHN